MLKVHQEEPTVTFYGLFREGAIAGRDEKGLDARKSAEKT